jgi:hypothetical protein
MKYVMITQRANHWDKLPYKTASFAKGMLKGEMSLNKLKENTVTTFIKLNIESGEPEKAWIGKVSKIRVLNMVITFSAELEKEIKPPKRYADYDIGWYVYK